MEDRQNDIVEIISMMDSDELRSFVDAVLKNENISEEIKEKIRKMFTS